MPVCFQSRYGCSHVIETEDLTTLLTLARLLGWADPRAHDRLLDVAHGHAGTRAELSEPSAAFLRCALVGILPRIDESEPKRRPSSVDLPAIPRASDSGLFLALFAGKRKAIVRGLADALAWECPTEVRQK